MRWSDYQLVARLSLLAACTSFEVICLYRNRIVTNYGSHRDLQLFRGQEEAHGSVKAEKSSRLYRGMQMTLLGERTREAYGQWTQPSRTEHQISS